MATSTRTTGTTTGHDADRMKKAAAAVGAVFLLVGIAGFIPGITTNYDELMVAGPDSEAKLLGLFQVSVLHNIVHLAFGVLGLLAAKAWDSAKLYLIGGGALYLVLLVYGLIVDKDSDANFVPFNTADNWLHLGLGVGMIALGMALAKDRDGSGTAARR